MTGWLLYLVAAVAAAFFLFPSLFGGGTTAA